MTYQVQLHIPQKALHTTRHFSDKETACRYAKEMVETNQAVEARVVACK